MTLIVQRDDGGTDMNKGGGCGGVTEKLWQ